MKQEKIRELQDLLTHEFGLNFDNSIKNKDLKKVLKKNMSIDELNKELNRFADYCFNNRRTVKFHEFRQFPYIIHKNKDLVSDHAGLMTNYLSSDFYFIMFVKNYLKKGKEGYSFPDVGYLIFISNKVEFQEISILHMPVDVILNL